MTKLIEFFKQPGKISAFLIHLTISGLLVGTLVLAVYFLWYPSPYLEHDGARDILRIVILVDVVLGPLLTLVLFRRGKKGVVRDVGMVAIIQLVAFVYGAGLMMQYRPAFLVFADDAFFAVRWPDVEPNTKDHERLDAIRVPVGPTMVMAELPADIEERKRIRSRAAVPFQGDLFREVTPERWKNILDKSIDMEKKVSAQPSLADSWAQFRREFLDNSGTTLDKLAFYEVYLRSSSIFIAIERDSRKIYGWTS